MVAKRCIGSLRGFGLAVLLVADPAGAGPMFVPIGFGETFEAPFSEAWDVSPDGSTVVGRTVVGREAVAYRWTTDGGIETFPGLFPSQISADAYGVSADGSTLVGRSRTSAGTLNSEGTVWSGGQVTGTGFLPADHLFSNLRAVSADGTKAVGNATSGDTIEAFYWTAEEGLTPLGPFPGGSVESAAFDISADGSVIVGEVQRADFLTEAFRWTEAEGFTGLGHLPGTFGVRSSAYAVSSDGTIIVGSAEINGTTVPTRWTAAEGMTSLGLPAGDWETSEAFGVSADGKTAVGKLRGDDDDIGRAFLWTEGEGTRELQGVLEDLGLDVTGWELEWATAVSDDGLTIVGWGNNPDGVREGWLVYVPEPGPGLLLALAAIMLRCRTRIRRPGETALEIEEFEGG